MKKVLMTALFLSICCMMLLFVSCGKKQTTATDTTNSTTNGVTDVVTVDTTGTPTTSGTVDTLPEKEAFGITVDYNAKAGNVTGKTSGFYDGDMATLTASPLSGCEFWGWYLDGKVVGTDSSITFEAKKGLKITALLAGSPDTAEKTLLKTAINNAKAASVSETYRNATAENAAKFDAEYEKSKIAYCIETDASKLKAYAQSLALATSNLGPTECDTSDLASAVEYASSLDLTRYSDTGKAEFTTALEAAVKLCSSSEASQYEIDNALALLVSSMTALRERNGD